MAGLKNGDVVVITGASSGIGRATALAFAAAGARLILVARDGAKLAVVREECLRLGAEALTCPADVTDAPALDRVAGRAIEAFGRLDVWVNDAGVGAVGDFTATPLEVHARVIETNLRGYLNGAYAALKIFVAQRRGTLINVASISAYVPQPTSVAYVTSKFGVRGLTYALRQDLGVAGLPDVHVCQLNPPVVDTAVFEHMANFSGAPVDLKLPTLPVERVARGVLRLVRRPRRELTLGLFGWFSVWGHRLFPGLAERMMIWLGRAYYAHRQKGRGGDRGNLFGPER